MLPLNSLQVVKAGFIVYNMLPLQRL